MTSLKKKIVLTGGGTAGHVMPHIAMLPRYAKQGIEVHYIGSKGIEKKLMSSHERVVFHQISAGKLRRYISLQNLIDVFKVAWGTIQSFFILAMIRPQLVFSKGGFVSVPVAVSAWLLRIPVYSHESDLTPGLANKIIKPFAQMIFYSFPDTKKYLDPSKSRLVGLPIREDLKKGDAHRGAVFCGLSDQEPTVLVMGGSLGAQRINEALEEILPDLVIRFQVIHITGQGKGLNFQHPKYKSFEFVGPELKDIFALSDFVVSRAGANSIFEFLALKKPMLLIPLEIGSRGDQVDNAKCFAKHGVARVLRETELSGPALKQAIESLDQGRSQMTKAMTDSFVPSDAEGLIHHAFGPRLGVAAQ
ncbi:undecaprenyldiphospho-muramoylpentapeptide beta-N-acetylglucosaminyltransferase [Pseudobacteriovorax antillogorgiicola]|uniref:UDP-N-acetylglucosamine--N-acetylmuramyl-(pentapeptide) pyrophosphoryl-undecaprenol N-acetylglucosamine transferase n=1 Tax=Pseudobacteriovorax antillogorgiicola TaxID=1513793 RepID=A0A1Y6B6A2_9BACT|nr:undecaprenyldiphospho-muramoylpentapeptide beta-N-acetylglucosaminyltransferase [Pseudobacteriovorax antillogorgiicola]TCS59555.1 UDP-N-acetylglucosamine-N-acetylmuramylpentapeptide N-acetylglucosamine transferase [Pseudobacteriovorax antillogorgiicola]SME87735.1 UDP-N-acetylglucosamine-N-acetylmuramylpentapeptide N-acetylglucosamine transferase [Pseudobacteriovorax antillogorgiicola]